MGSAFALDRPCTSLVCHNPGYSSLSSGKVKCQGLLFISGFLIHLQCLILFSPGPNCSVELDFVLYQRGHYNNISSR